MKRELPLVDAVAIGQERTQAGDLWWSWTNSPQAKRRTGLAGTVKKVLAGRRDHAEPGSQRAADRRARGLERPE